MNLRINPDAIRFRISISELDQLLETRHLENTTQLVDGLMLVYGMTLGELPEESVRNLLHLNSTLSAAGTSPSLTLSLTISPEAQQRLLQSPPSKEGLTDFKTQTDGSILTIGLEVDTKSQRQEPSA